MDSNRNIAYIVFVAAGIVVLAAGFWYRRRQRQILAARAQAEQAEYEQFTAAMARDNAGQWDNVPLHPQRVHLVYEPLMSPATKPEYLPPYQPSDLPPYPGPSSSSTMPPPPRVFTRSGSE
ncbi:hypothetical protein IW148_002590 [Coemansia sp. RSA 1199]|nr:hypothetical protein IW148_002590 [Coemansia sp. RSA 1199]